ncbi:MAG: tRNA pseudouridine(38-40) synthase TruA [Planctomycetales bacterium]|nr:tRNA pseudouridine(38-40) synthase TruA [Planctomycetales bacterium]
MFSGRRYGGQPVMRTIKLTIAYDGTAYAGWQYQPDRTTVQQTLENALEKVTGERIRVLASGRTDAGVHALGQVVGFSTECKLPLDVLHRAINANLPPDVAVLEAAEAPEGFHPISHARRKRYRYAIHDGPVRDVFQRHYAWHYRRGRLDAEAMRRAAVALLGTHDFSSFETAGAKRATSVRTVFDISIRRGEGLGIRDWELGVRDCCNAPRLRSQGACSSDSDDSIVIEVEADGFLYNMVRTIVGTLVEVGCGKRPESWPGEVLRAADRRAAGPTAPPQGLFLVRVEY